jgi:hypothetical protein
MSAYRPTPSGRVALKLKTAWRDGATHPVMSPLAFMQRLAVLIDPAAAAPANDRTWTPPFAKLSVHGGMEEKIAPVHSDCHAGIARCP